MISVVLGFHLCVSRRSLQLTLALVCWCWLGWFLLVSVGELIFDLFLTSSNNLTATVESNAATEKRSCLFATYGALSVLLNDAALGALINITYACSVNDEELSSSPPLGARTHGLPMMTDWKSLEASCCPIHTDILCNGEWYILTVVAT